MAAQPGGAAPARIGPPRPRRVDLRALGEPERWAMGGALALGILLILGFLLLVLWNGVTTFWPQPLVALELEGGGLVAGEPTRSERFRPSEAQRAALSPEQGARLDASGGGATRVLYRVGNFDLYGEDFRWVADYEVTSRSTPPDLWFFERVEWGPFVGRIAKLRVGAETLPAAELAPARLRELHRTARERFEEIRAVERGEIGAVNRQIEERRLAIRAVALAEGAGSAAHRRAEAEAVQELTELEREHQALSSRAAELRRADAAEIVTLADWGGREKELPLSTLTRFYPANELGVLGKLRVYFGRWLEFLTDEPREANTEGGVLPAIFGTAAMTLLMVIVVTPFGVVTALYLREYAHQGRLVSIVRISVNNLAGVPSIVYGVFGLGFFAYTLGVRIDELLYANRLPSPTFGTGGLLWASLTLALLTVPVVIVATEEALAAVPRSVREGSLACGASKWQTIRRVVLPQAMPGIMTGLILAMARGAGEVAPLMLVGVVKLAPELPVDGTFPFVHFERSFMHLGFHIYDVGFQSRNSEAGKPMVFVTTLLLITLIFFMNVTAIWIRARLKRRFAGSQF